MPANRSKACVMPSDGALCVTISTGAFVPLGETGDLVERLMGKKPELRFQYISENARFVEDVDV